MPAVFLRRTLDGTAARGHCRKAVLRENHSSSLSAHDRPARKCARAGPVRVRAPAPSSTATAVPAVRRIRSRSGYRRGRWAPRPSSRPRAPRPRYARERSWSEAKFGTLLFGHGPFHRFDFILDPRKLIAFELTDCRTLNALDEGAAPADELVTQDG